MKVRFSVLTAAISLLSLAWPGARGVGAAPVEYQIAPVSYSTVQGSTSGQPVSALAVMDQSGQSDDPAAYVKFITPNVPYVGGQDFHLPPGVARDSVNAMRLRVNFKGPVRKAQRWSWYLYDYRTGRWVKIGDNNDVRSDGAWSSLDFPVAKARAFISTGGVIRVLLRSNNADGDADIDYEAIALTGSASTAPTGVPPTATPTTLPATSTPITIPPTATPIILPPTATPITIPPTATPITVPPTATPITVPATATPIILPTISAPTSVPSTSTPTTLPATSTSTATPAASTPLPTATLSPAGATYYVSTQGSDTNPGTQNTPWRTIQKAADSVAEGSTVIVQAGTYAERVNISRSGSAGAPITFQAQGGVAMQGFTLNNASHVVINGFEISNKSQDSTNGWGIYVAGANNVITNNYVHDTTWGGIMLFVPSTDLGLSNNNVVQNNRIAHVGELGIDVRGRNNVVAYNDISGVMQYPAWMTNPPGWVDADGIHFHGSGHIIRGNYIHDILYSDPANVDPHIDCFQTFAAAPYKEPGSNVVFEQNRCVNAQATGTQKHGSGFMINGASGITIRNNLINAYVGVNALYSSQLTIVNNTFTSDLSLSSAFYPAGITFTSVSDSTVQNNILYDQPGHLLYLSSVTGLSAGKNLEYRSDGKPLWTTPSYAHADDLWGIDPRFVAPGDYHLQAGSPAVDAGYAVPVTNDYEGRPRPQGQGYDIGAFER